jgi:hypothetical protein
MTSNKNTTWKHSHIILPWGAHSWGICKNCDPNKMFRTIKLPLSLPSMTNFHFLISQILHHQILESTQMKVPPIVYRPRYPEKLFGNKHQRIEYFHQIPYYLGNEQVPKNNFFISQYDKYLKQELIKHMLSQSHCYSISLYCLNPKMQNFNNQP